MSKFEQAKKVLKQIAEAEEEEQKHIDNEFIKTMNQKQWEKDFEGKFPPFKGIGAPYPMFLDNPNVEHIKQFIKENFVHKSELLTPLERAGRTNGEIGKIIRIMAEVLRNRKTLTYVSIPIEKSIIVIPKERLEGEYIPKSEVDGYIRLIDEALERVEDYDLNNQHKDRADSLEGSIIALRNIIKKHL